jgi:O-succinylbenzoic acid--CoA ligase
MMVVRAFVIGLNLIPVKPTNIPLQYITEFLDFAALTPMQVSDTLKQENGINQLNQVKNLIIGGGEINHHLINIIRKLQNNSYHTYGMTETLTHIALKKLNGTSPDSCFHALPGVKFEKDDRNCLVILAPHLSPKKFLTNDIVDLVNEKSFNFIGRHDNVINSGGIKIFPELVEQKLLPFIQNRFIIAGLPDEKLGFMVVLMIESKEKRTLNFSKADLSKYQIPKEVYYLDNFPETENGKIIRHEVVRLVLKKYS